MKSEDVLDMGEMEGADWLWPPLKERGPEEKKTGGSFTKTS